MRTLALACRWGIWASVLWGFPAGCAGEGGTRLSLTDWVLPSPSTGPLEVRLPDHLPIPDDSDSYTLRTAVDLGPELTGRTVDLVIPRFTGVVRAYGNGEELVRLNEDPSPSRHRAVGRQEFRIPEEATETGSVELSLEVRHTWTQSAWFDTVPFIVADATWDPFVWLLAASEGGFWMAAWFIAQLTLIYIWVFVSYPRPDYGWIIVQAATAIPYTLFSAGIIDVAPGVDEALFAVPLAVAPVAAIHFAYHHVGLGPPPRVWLWLLGLVVLVMIAGHGPHRSTRLVGWVVCPLIVGGGLFLLVRMAQEYRRSANRFDAGTLFVAWLCLLVLCASDFLVWMGFGEIFGGVRLAPLGMALYVVSQGALLGRGHASSELELGQRLEQAEDRNAEIGRLNDELRHQLQQRSRQLFSALAVASGRAAPAPALAEGDVVQGRYRVTRKIGAGGMGDVYEVIRLVDQRRLALKLTQGLSGESLARLALEAQVASKLDHPHLVRIEDIDLADSGFLYIVMEYVEGPELTSIEDTGTLLELLSQLAEALLALHEAGVIHRDLKPANVLVDGTLGGGTLRVKLADFGISSLEGTLASSPPPPPGSANSPGANEPRADRSTAPTAASPSPGGVSPTIPAPDGEHDELDGDTSVLASSVSSGPLGSEEHPGSGGSDSSSGLTRDGLVLGTPAYLAPELADGERAGPAADIFSFGVLIYELLAGDHPFPKPAFKLRLAQEDIPEPAVRDALGRFGDDLAARVALALSEDPAKRPSTQELTKALRLATKRVSTAVRISKGRTDGESQVG